MRKLLLLLLFLPSLVSAQTTGGIYIRNTSASAIANVPVSIPMPFRQGDIPQCVAIFWGVEGGTIAPLTSYGAYVTQTDVKNRWPDGSIKFAIVSFLVPSLAAGQMGYVQRDNQASCNNTGFLTRSAILADSGYNFSANIAITGPTNPTLTPSAVAILTAAPSCAAPGSDPDGVIENNLCTYWLQGPVVTAIILEDRGGRSFDINTDGGTGNPLHPRFEAWLYPTTHQVQVGYTLANEWASATATNSARNQTINSIIFTGAGNTEYSQGTSFVLHPFSFVRHTYCINNALSSGVVPNNCLGSALAIDHNWAYMTTAKLAPNWNSQLPFKPTVLTGLTTNYANASKIFGGCASCYAGPNGGIGNYTTDINGGGASPMHGPLPSWEVPYLMTSCGPANSTAVECGNGGNGDMQTVVLGNADFGGNFPIFFMENDANAGHGQTFDNSGIIGNVQTKGRILSVNARQQVNMEDTTQQAAFCTVSSAPFDWINVGTGGQDQGLWPMFINDSTSHWPNLAFGAYLMTGQYDYYQEQQMQAAWTLGASTACSGFNGSNTAYLRHGQTGYYYSGQERAVNWAMRENALGAVISIDGSPEKAYLEDKLYNNIAWTEGMNDIPNDTPPSASHTAAWNFGNASSALTSFPGRHNPTPGPSPLGAWFGIQAYVTNPPICQTVGQGGACLTPQPPVLADANFQAGYSGVMRGWIYELGYSTVAPLQYTAKRYTHLMMDPAFNQFDLASYAFPIQTATAAWIPNAAGLTFNIDPTQRPTTFAQDVGVNCGQTGSSGLNEGALPTAYAAMSYGATYGLTDGGFSATDAFNKYATAFSSCVTGIGSGSTKTFISNDVMYWIVPRITTSISAAGGPATVANPTFSPVAGTYVATQNVAISTATPSATICWTSDGTNPTTNGAGTCTHGTTYSGTISVAVSETLKAIATLSGDTDSAIVSAAYVIGGAPVVSLSPTSVAFGSVPVGTPSSTHNVTITNTGTATLNISSITFTGTNPGDFSAASNTCNSTLAAGNNCVVGVVFTPTVANARSANLTFTTNASTSPNNVALSGTGTAGPMATFTPNPLNFGGIKAGNTSATLAVTLQNTGGATMNITSIASTGANATDFSIMATTCGATLAPGATCTISVAFTPLALGSRNASVSVTSNTITSPDSFSMTGSGFYPINGTGKISGSGTIIVQPF